jgi:L-arabinose isomerase
LNKLPLQVNDISSIVFEFAEENVFYVLGHSQEDFAVDKASEETDLLRKKIKKVKPIRCEKVAILENGEVLASTVAFLSLSRADEDLREQIVSY